MTITSLPVDGLLRRCDPQSFDFETTEELPELEEILGQERAVGAVAFGIAIRRPGFNLYAMGPEGTGKYTVIRQFLSAQAPSGVTPSDWCYVHSFSDPRRPKALRLPPGRGRRVRDRMIQLNRELRAAIPAAFESDAYRTRRQGLEEHGKKQREQALSRFEKHALNEGAALLRTPIGVGLAPIRDGRAIESTEFEKLPEPEKKAIRDRLARLEADLAEILTRKVPRWEREQRDALRQLDEETTRAAVHHLIEDVREEFVDLEAVGTYLTEVEADIVANAELFLTAGQRDTAEAVAGRLAIEEGSEFRRYQVNLLVDNADTKGAPVVFEDHPTLANLAGRIEHVARLGTLVTDFTLVRSGALHRANGGYLVLDVRRVLQQPFAWEELTSALRSGEIRMENLGERLGLMSTVSLEPEPIPLDVKVVLVGDRRLYYLLAELDPDFLELFKVQADFDEQFPRTPELERRFVQLLGTVARREGLRPLDRTAAARMIEHAARLAGDAERLSSHMRSLTDVLREADQWSRTNGHDRLTAADISRAIEARLGRMSRIKERVLDELARGSLLIATRGEAVGQVNGLSVVPMAEASFGWPTRITARVSLGDGDVLDIEREVELGGPVHSKGVLILVGFVRGRYGRGSPFHLRASLVFEQSYGAVEGDSASLAETCALLSSIGGLQIRQSVAVTGSINQLGEVQPVGAINEKVEGFFDACEATGLTGDQRVVIPEANIKHLMLRDDVVAAVDAGRFGVVAVATVDEAMETLTGRPAGTQVADQWQPTDSVNAAVERGLLELAERAKAAWPGLLPVATPRLANGAGRRKRRHPVPG